MFVFLFISFLFLSKPVFAEDTPTANPSAQWLFDITSAPDEIEKGKNFSINFRIKNGQPNTEYTLKVFDCRGDRACFVKTINQDNVLKIDSNWDLFPKYTTGLDGEISDTIIGLIDDCTDKYLVEGDYAQLKLKTRVGDTTPYVQGINILLPTPTLTITPTSIPTNTPVPTATQTPTIISTPLDISPSSTQTDIPTPYPTQEITSQVLGTTSPQTQNKASNPRQILPVIFMVTGGGFLITPTLVTKFKKK